MALGAPDFALALEEHARYCEALERCGLELVRVTPGEEYAANCVRVNDHVLMAAGFPGMKHTLEQLGYGLIVLDMSGFQKMYGGLSCLSLRF